MLQRQGVTHCATKSPSAGDFPDTYGAHAALREKAKSGSKSGKRAAP
jgi:hypothetical protein